MAGIGNVNGVRISTPEFAVASLSGNDIGAGGFIDDPSRITYYGGTVPSGAYTVGLTNNGVVQVVPGTPGTINGTYGPGRYLFLLQTSERYGMSYGGPVYGKYIDFEITDDGSPVYLQNESGGLTFLVNTGSILGEAELDGGTLSVNNSGYIRGIEAFADYGGTVLNSGTIASYGIDGGSNLNVANTGLLGSSATEADNSSVVSTSGTVTNQGTILGGVRAGAFVNSKLITGVNYALVTAYQVTNLAGGTILATGTSAAIDANGTGVATILNAGLVSGTYNGVSLGEGSVNNLATGTITTAGPIGVEAGGYATLKNAGTIMATGTGHGSSYFSGFSVELGDGGTLINQTDALILSTYGAGVAVDGDDDPLDGGATLLNFGTIQAGPSGLAGAFVLGDGTVVNGAGALITGSTDGLVEFAAAASVSNAGTIQSRTTLAGSTFHVGTLNVGGPAPTGVYFIGITGANSAYLSNAAGGTIGGVIGVYDAAPNGTVLNAGTIQGGGGSGFGVVLNKGGTLTNAGGAVISTATSLASTGNLLQAYGVVVRGGAGTVSNAGQIYAHNEAVALGAGGVFKNQVGGLVEVNTTLAGATYADVLLGGTVQSTVFNAGTIGTAATNAPSPAVTAAAGLYLSNLATGTIGGSYGVRVSGGATTITNAGSIVAFGTAGGTSAGIAITGATDPAYVSNAAGGVVAGYFGVEVSGAAGTVVNAGTIAFTPATYNALGLPELNTLSSGISLAGGGTVVNRSGAVVAATAAGVSASVAGTQTTVVNAGTITGNLGVAINAGTVTNQAGGTIATTGRQVPGGVVDIATYGTVLNAGSISSVQGIFIHGGGTSTAASYISNASTGVIGPGNISVYLGATGSVVNVGKVEGATEIAAGDTVVNMSGGYLSGVGTLFDVVTTKVTTVVNAGTIVSSEGVHLKGPSLVINQAGGFIQGNGVAAGSTGAGIFITDAPGTVVDAGTINSVNFDIGFAGGFNNRLVLEPGATFNTGTGGAPVLQGSNYSVSGPSSTIELAAGTGGLSGFGTGIRGFNAITFDPGASWLLGGAADGFTGPITGFHKGDTIDLFNFTAQSSSYLNGYLNLTSASAPEVSLNLLGSFTTASFSVFSDGAGGTDVSLACYLAGTWIRTPRGDVAIETLAIGDPVLTASGALRPIRWIGRRRYAGRFLARNPRLLPIRIAAGALGAGVPVRDLYVSADHAMLLDGVLVPAGDLVNGGTIQRAAMMQRVDYIHLELASHDAVLAEGAPSETFIDDDSRFVFENATEYARLYPDAPPSAGFCAPRRSEGSAVEAIRQRLNRVAAAA